jgi:hypothetical protein
MTMPHVKAFQGRTTELLDSDAFAFDALAVDQASSDASDSLLPMESILPADSTDYIDQVTVTDDPPYLGDGSIRTLSDSIDSTDWILINSNGPPD